MCWSVRGDVERFGGVEKCWGGVGKCVGMWGDVGRGKVKGEV